MSQYKKSEETKRVIFEAATQLFYEKGYAKTTVRDIAERTGLSLSRVNYHFHSKADLAGIVCRKLFEDINNRVYRTIFPLTDDLMVKDVIHIRILASVLFSTRPHMRFYYEAACENILTDILIPSSQRHFREQADYLQAPLTDEILLGYSYIFVAILVEFIKSSHEGVPDLSKSQFLDILNTTHLKLLNISKPERDRYLDEVKKLMGQISIKTETLIHTEISHTISKAESPE